MLYLCLRKFLLAIVSPHNIIILPNIYMYCICVMPVTVNDTPYCRRWYLHCLLILLVWMIRRRWLNLYLQWCSGLVDRSLYTLCKDQMETTRHLYLHTSVLSCQKCKNTSLYDYMMCKCLWCADYRYYPRIWILVKMHSRILHWTFHRTDREASTGASGLVWFQLPAQMYGIYKLIHCLPEIIPSIDIHILETCSAGTLVSLASLCFR